MSFLFIKGGAREYKDLKFQRLNTSTTSIDYTVTFEQTKQIVFFIFKNCDRVLFD